MKPIKDWWNYLDNILALLGAVLTGLVLWKMVDWIYLLINYIQK